MMHTKLTLITVILVSFAAVSALDCTQHPLKPANLTAGDWANASVTAGANMTFCKALAGKEVCMTPQGRVALKAKFTATKARFMAKRNEHLAQFKLMQDNYVKQLPQMVDAAADMVAEGASSFMLSMRLFVNAMKRWECKYYQNGTFNMNDCPGMEDPAKWIAENGKNINKDVLKNMIQIGLAILEAANGTDFDPKKQMRMLAEDDSSWDDMNFGEFNETMKKWMAFANMTTDKEQIEFLQANPDMIKEVPFEKIRVLVRKFIKPEVKKALYMYHSQKLAAFSAQRNCFRKLFKIHTSMQCAKMSAETAFVTKDLVNNKTYLNVKKNAMANYTKVCMQSVRMMAKLGEAFTEVEGEMYVISRYPMAKKEWIKWKKMLNAVSKSDMKLNTLLRIVVYKIFEKNGLWDQGHVWERAELENLKKVMTEKKFWDMNMNVPEDCTNTTCAKVKAWVGVNGISDDAANMKNFQVADSQNATLKDIDTNLDVFDKYEKSIDTKENEAAAEEWAKGVIAALNGDMSILEKLLNGTNPFGERRMLAESDVILVEVDDGTAGAMDAGLDDQLDESELADVTGLDATEEAANIASQAQAADDIKEEDTGTVGDDSNTDDMPDEDASKKGTSFMTWVMYIGGAILVLALIAGACYLVTQKRDADNFTHEQQDTEMSMPSHGHEGHH